jgi:hypothetical protein
MKQVKNSDVASNMKTLDRERTARTTAPDFFVGLAVGALVVESAIVDEEVVVGAVVTTM